MDQMVEGKGTVISIHLTFIKGTWMGAVSQLCHNIEKEAAPSIHTGSKVQAKVRLRPKLLAPLQELVGAELVRFGS